MSSPSTQTYVETLANDRPKKLSPARKLAVLSILCCVKFLDIFSSSGFFSAIPIISASLGFAESQSVWITSAFLLTYASSLLISGRITDIYGPKIVYIGGITGLCLMSLCGGFANNKILMIVLRALAGMASSMTVPSGLTLLVGIFPDPLPQARALSIFAGFGSLATTPALLIGAALVDSASYHWVFWFVAIVAVPVAMASLLIIPSQMAGIADSTGSSPATAKWKKLDIVGVSIITVALTLFVFAVTSSSTDGWASATVVVSLVVSIFMVAGFFYWETIVPVENASIPPRTWFYNNFSVLFAVAFVPLLWWSAVSVILTSWWLKGFHWSLISSAVHMIPIGVIAFAVSFSGGLARIFNPKWIILSGLTLCMVATALLVVGGGKPDDYWPFVFPAFVVGTSGAMLVVAHANIAMFQAVPTSMIGTVGAIFGGALQLGSALGLAIMSAVETSVEPTHGGPGVFYGRAASFCFLLALVAVEFILISIFYNRNRSADNKLEPEDDKVMVFAQNNNAYCHDSRKL